MAHGKNRAPIWRVVVATVVLSFVLNSSIAAPAAQNCKLIGSAYRLIDNPNFEFVFHDTEKPSDVSFSISDKGEVFLSGDIFISNGVPVSSIVSDQLKWGGTLYVAYLGKDMKDLEDFDYESASFYLVIPELSAALYYSDPNHQPKHFVKGTVWKRVRCG